MPRRRKSCRRFVAKSNRRRACTRVRTTQPTWHFAIFLACFTISHRHTHVIPVLACVCRRRCSQHRCLPTNRLNRRRHHPHQHRHRSQLQCQRNRPHHLQRQLQHYQPVARVVRVVVNFYSVLNQQHRRIAPISQQRYQLGLVRRVQILDILR